MTNFRIWKPHTNRWLLIDEQSGTLYDTNLNGKQLNVVSSSGLAKGDYETIDTAVAKFEALTSQVSSPVGLTFKVSV